VCNKIKRKRKKKRWKRRGKQGAGQKDCGFPRLRGERRGGATPTFYIRNIIL